jgi:hypothetical protein
MSGRGSQTQILRQLTPGVESCKSIFFGVDLVGGVYPVRKRGEQAEGHRIADIGSSPTSQVIGKMENRGYVIAHDR